MKCPVCEVIFPDQINACPRCRIGLVTDNTPPDPQVKEDHRNKVRLAREQRIQAGRRRGRGADRGPRQTPDPVAMPEVRADSEKPAALEPEEKKAEPVKPAVTPEKVKTEAAAAPVKPEKAKPEKAKADKARQEKAVSASPKPPKTVDAPRPEPPPQPVERPEPPPPRHEHAPAALGGAPAALGGAPYGARYDEEREEAPSGGRMPIYIGVAAVMIIAAIALWWIKTKETRAFAAAEKVNTIEAYQAFMSQFPEGDKYGDSLQKIAAIRFDQVKDSKDLAEWEQFIEEFGKTEYARDAETEYEKLLWNAARKKEDVALYRRFLDKFPNTQNADLAREEIGRLEQMKAFFNSPGKITKKIDTAAVGDNIALWAALNLHPGDSLFAFSEDAEKLGSVTLRDVKTNSSGYRFLVSTKGQVAYYAIQFPSIPGQGSDKLPIAVNFTRFNTWLPQSQDSAKQFVVEALREAAPSEMFTIVYPPDPNTRPWGTVSVDYSDQRYMPAVDVPAASGGKGFRSTVSIRLTLQTAVPVEHSWKNASVSENSPRVFPADATGNPDVVLRDAAIRLAAVGIPRLTPKQAGERDAPQLPF